MADPKPSFLASPSRPKLKLPAGACDTHVHVFGPHRVFPFADPRPFTPADAPKDKLFALHAMLGIGHCVIVQSTCHGFDNRVVADAIAAKNGDYCGVALLPATVEDAELRRLDAQGFRGVRFNFMKHLGKGAGIQEAVRLGERLAKLGWHLQVHFEASLIEQLAPFLKRSAVPVVIDHMGRVDAVLGVDQPAFKSLLELMRDARSREKPPPGPTRGPSRERSSPNSASAASGAATGRTRISQRFPTTACSSICFPRSRPRRGSARRSWSTIPGA